MLRHGPSRGANTQILSTKITSCNYKQAFTKLLAYLKKNNGPSYITVNNVHTVVMACQNSNYSQILNNSLMMLPDGKPLSIVAHWKGDKNMQRVFGPTFFEKTLDWGQEHNIRHFLFGSSVETLQQLVRVINLKFPNAEIVGMISPPYGQFASDENFEFIDKINNSKTDIIWVSLGAPKQEIWMYENYKHLNRGIMIGIGAGFDYLAGNIKHAPRWMKDFSLEWLYRLIQEPKRLWKRYLISNTLFVFFIILALLHIKRYNN